MQTVIVSNERIPFLLCIRFYYSKLKEIENVAINTFLHIFPNYNCLIFGRNGKQKGNKFCYELYLSDTDNNYDILKSHGFEISELIPSSDSFFATTTVKNNEQKINTAWDYLYSEWLQNSMFEYTDEPYYEEYIVKNGKVSKLKLYLPIRERAEATKIRLINNPELHFITAKAKGYNAEEIASQTLIDYLTTHYPHIFNTSKKLYLRKELNAYICGVMVNSEMHLIKDENITNIFTNQNDYLVLESNVIGDYDRYAEMLFAFALDNSMSIDKKEIFAVYEAKESFNNLKMKMYCPIKIRTK